MSRVSSRSPYRQKTSSELANGKAAVGVYCSPKLAELLEVAHAGETGDEIQEEEVVSLEWNKGAPARPERDVGLESFVDGGRSLGLSSPSMMDELLTAEVIVDWPCS